MTDQFDLFDGDRGDGRRPAGLAKPGEPVPESEYPGEVMPTCQHGTGPFTNRGTPGAPWWVHADPKCLLPTAGWLATQEGLDQ